MNPRAFISNLMFAASLIWASDLQALANRVFVSARTGNDSNSCDNVVTPCQTFAGAVLQLNPGGEAIVLDSGGYGPVTITKALTIEAPPGVLAFIHPPSGDAITINAGASDKVVLRGLVLNVGSGNGINVNTVGSLLVQDCTISGFNFNGIRMGTPGNLDVWKTNVKSCSVGIEVNNTSGTVKASIDRCQLDGNSVGFRSRAVGSGKAVTTATNTTANNNSSDGWVCGETDGTDILNLEFCTGSGNGFEGIRGNSSNAASVVRYSNCVFSNNSHFGVARFNNGTFESRTSNTFANNGTADTLGVIGTFAPN